MKSAFIRIAKKLLVIAVWLSIWQLLSSVIKNPVLLPSPLSVLRALFSLCRTADFWESVGLSFLRIILGFSSGAVLGTAVAGICLLSKPVHEFLSPVITIARSTPVASFIILALVWLRKPWVPVLIVLLIVFPVWFQNIFDNIRNTPEEFDTYAKIYDLSLSQRIRHIYSRTVIPAVKTSAITSFGLAWKSGVAAEVIAVPVMSIGYNLHRSKINIETESLFAWTIVVILLSCLLEAIIKRTKKDKKGEKTP